MTDKYQALREAAQKANLADWLEAVGGGPSAKRCAALLREQHARIAELEAQLEAVGAGGVQALSAGPGEQQAAPKAVPGEPFDECFPGEPRVAVPQGLISAACFAIRNKRDGGKVLEQLRRYSVGDLSQPLAPQQEAQEPSNRDTVNGASR